MTDPLSDSELEALQRQYAADVRRLVAAATAADAARVWKQVEARTHTKLPTDKSTRRSSWPTRTLLGLSLLGVGAAVVAVIRPLVSSVPSAVHTYTAVPGHRATITLADGSRAVLAPATTLRVTTDGRDGATSVTVTGEALFTVAHHARRPFVVRTGHVVTQVLGTRFLVRRYPGDLTTRVIVADGRVAVHEDLRTSVATPFVLSASMMAVVSDSGSATVTPDIALDDYTSLQSNRLVFHATTVSDVIAAINRTYDVDIHLADTTLAAHKLTMMVPVTQWSVDDVLAVIVKALNARYVRNGRVVVISSDGVTHHRQLTHFKLEAQYGR